MAEFCSGINTETITVSNYKATFSGTSCLPSNGFSSVDPKTGIVSENAISEWVRQLLTTRNATAPTDINGSIDAPSKYATNAAALKNSIKSEYCFYYVRYIWALTKVLNDAAVGTSSSDQGYPQLKLDTQALNSKLNQILQVLKGLVNSRGETLESYYGSSGGINSLNSQLDKTRDSLMDHMGKLQGANMENDAKVAMMEYTIEKNNSSRNMLAIYGFMNIIAIGMLVYLYRSSK
jgi:hypothetical protein